MKVVALLAAALAGIACASGRLSLEELPNDPIALSYWDEEEARRRAHLLEEKQGMNQSPVPAREGVAEIESIGRFLGAEDFDREFNRYPGRLSLLDPTTMDVTRVAAAPPGARPLAWSPDRRRLVFSSNRGGEFHHLYEYDLESQVVRPLTHGRRSYSDAAVGPDGRYAYFGWEKRPAGDYAAVYVTEPGGREPRVLFEDEIVEDLAWAADGRSLVYTSVGLRPRRDGSRTRHIVLRPVEEGGEARALAPGRSPSVTPDGQWIVYSSPLRDGGWQLRRMRIDGSSRTTLGKRTLRDEIDPTVSPDGRFVVYTGDENGMTRLFVRRFDGTGERVLLTEGVGASPVW